MIESLSTTNNIIIILLYTIGFIRLALWYFKKDSPFLNSEETVCAFVVLLFTTSFITGMVFMHPNDNTRFDPLIVNLIVYILALLGIIIGQLLKIRELLPDSRTNTKDK